MRGVLLEQLLFIGFWSHFNWWQVCNDYNLTQILMCFHVSFEQKYIPSYKRVWTPKPAHSSFSDFTPLKNFIFFFSVNA